MKSRWSHAGGVVVRTIEGEPEYLLVEASDRRDVWVLPKGQIKKEEAPEAAAVREVMEEAGVRAEVVARVALPSFISSMANSSRFQRAFAIVQAQSPRCSPSSSPPTSPRFSRVASSSGHPGGCRRPRS